ncbi:hypothetical protein Bca52824_009352 [Brassica carinata]|uniref:Uncharacterized protein n=1 Tax=Brassica carinata TaxID=52824 RepID=A0A8X7W9R6_BRACI|nr:hypothetical protein Bca52824_009352 [Brassica carinata]
MSDKTLVSKPSRPDKIPKLLDPKENQGMIEDDERSKLDSRVNIHSTRSRGGSLVEEVIDKLERFKVRTVNILVGGEADEQKK